MYYNKENVERLRQRYPEGTRICLDQMNDDPFPVESGTFGKIDGKEYELDISFKKYKQVESISDEIEKQNIDVDISDFKDSSDFYLYLSKFDDQSFEEISVNVTGKMIVQKNISKIVGLSIILDTIIKKFDRRKPFEGTHRTVVCST